MKKLLFILGCILLINIFALTGCTKKSDSEDEKNNKKEEVIQVQVQPIGIMNFENKLSLPGNLKPKEEAMVTSEEMGKVKEIYKELGNNVKKGELICKLDDTNYKLEYEGSNKDVSVAKLEYISLTADYERIKDLYENGAESKMAFEKMQKSYDVQKQVLEIKENALAMAMKKIEDTNIKSPITGIVSDKKVLMGQTVSSGVELFRVVNIEQMYVEVGIPEKDISFVKKNQECIVKVDISDKVYTGNVIQIGPEPSNETKTYPVRILINNIEKELKPGMFSTVEIIIDAHKDVLGVPKKAVINENDKYYVFLEENKKAVKKEVNIGFSNDKYYEILDGVKKGDKVIVVGNEDLNNGALIEAK